MLIKGFAVSAALLAFAPDAVAGETQPGVFRRDPHAAAAVWRGSQSRFSNKPLWLWAPAFAGATAALIQFLPDSPQKFNASPWENDSCRRKNRLKSTR